MEKFYQTVEDPHQLYVRQYSASRTETVLYAL